ncbi:MAG: alpha-galactosidase [Clostridia bacterium]|nr:alpha-galactosidase [Clostridia bacterium]
MAIIERDGCFKLDTKNTTYAFHITKFGFLMHTHYGAKVSDVNLDYVFPLVRNRSYINSPAEDTGMVLNLTDAPQEYSGFGVGDFRTTALRIRHNDGSRAADLRYCGYEIIDGVVQPEKLPCATQNDAQNVQTLKITLKDSATEVYVNMYYTVYEDTDVITRFNEIVNKGNTPIYIEKAASLQLDLFNRDYDLVQFEGRWAQERHMRRAPLAAGTQGFVSRRGTSSHNHSPFFCLCERSATETAGGVYGFHLVYSGNHRTEVEVAQFDNPRVLMGINDEGFCWKTDSGDKFTTPQAFMTYSADGFGAMSRNLHTLIREQIFRPRWKGVRRPLLINNWEATYFDFDQQKLIDLATTAGKLGIELLVMDDGWFGHREDDKTSLGDWVPYKKRLPAGLKPLAEGINNAGLKFGIWMEPEMISEDSDLYKAHPDWVLEIPGRGRSIGRNQYVLNLVNDEVKEYVVGAIFGVLESANIEYLKWDMNRHLTEVYSATLSADSQGEAYHRYVLAVYEILDRVITKFPNLLIEHCSGGGGRFDTGMLYYSPQIWTSDDTDAIERLDIQHGTSFGFPITSMGSHVSAVPNHQSGRVTSMSMRANVAYSGTFGYELDINKLTDEEREMIKAQTAFYKENYDIINNGDYFRLAKNDHFTAWGFATPDRKEMLIFFVQLEGGPNGSDAFVKLDCADNTICYKDIESGKTYYGDTLKNIGLCFPLTQGERKAYCKHFKAM